MNKKLPSLKAACAGLLMALPLAQANAALLYTLTDLGTLGGTYSAGSGINASGQVTGYSATPGDASNHAFLYDGTTMHDLGTLGGSGSAGTGINSSGQVTGYSNVSGNSANHAFLYDGSTMKDLGTFGGNYDWSLGYGINDSGQVAGTVITRGSPNGDPITQRAFMYDGTTMNNLGTLGGTYSYGYGINASGQVTGYSGVYNSGYGHAFLYDGTTMHDLGALGGIASQGFGINASGQVTGQVVFYGAAYAYFYDGTTMHVLGSLGGSQSVGYGINASGQVTGWSYTNGDADTHAFLYDSGALYDLNDLITGLSPGTSVTLRKAEFGSINDAGQIVANGTLTTVDGTYARAFLLSPITPVPLPTTVWLLAPALGCLRLVHRRAA